MEPADNPNSISLRRLQSATSGAGMPTMPKISTSYPSRPGRAFSMRGRLYYDADSRLLSRMGQDLLFGFQFVYLLNMNCETTGSIQSPWAHTALEVFRLLMLHKHWGSFRVAPKSEGKYAPFSSSNSLSQYQHQGRRTYKKIHKKGQRVENTTNLLVLLLPHCE